MATQDKIAISNPSFAAETRAFSVVAEKDKKKQKAGLAHLAALLNALEEEVSGAKAEVKGGSDKVVSLNATQATAKSGAADGANGAGFGDAMAKLALLLQMLQVEIAKASNAKAKLDGSISDMQVQQAQEALTNFNKEMAKMAAQKASESFWQTIAEAATILITAVIDIVALATGQIWLAVLTTTLAVASLTGALGKATKAVGGALADHIVMPIIKLLKPHMSQADLDKTEEDVTTDCDLVVAIAIALAVIVLSGNIAPAAGVEAAATTAEEGGVEMTDFAAEGAQEGEAAAQASSQAASLGSKILQVLSKLKLSAKASAMIMGGTQAIAQTGIPGYIADAIIGGETNLSPDERAKRKAEAELVANLIFTVLSLVATIGSGASLMKGMSAGARDLSQLGKLEGLIKKIRESEKFLEYTKMLQNTGVDGQALAGVSKGSIQIQEGDIEKAMAVISANLGLIQAGSDMNTRQVREDTQHQASVMKQQSTDIRSLSKLLAGEAAIANTLTSYSPV